MTIIFEDLDSGSQNLSFDRITQFITDKLGPTARIKNLRTPTGKYSNFALSVSDQCPWRIRLQMYGEPVPMDGPLPVQFEMCIDHIFDDMPSVPILNRIATFKRFPKSAVQEALVNAMIHCDLSAHEDISVTVEEDLVTVWSPGGLFRPDEWDNVRMANPRNPSMANLFCSLDLAFLKNRGTTIIKSSYASSGVIPCIIRNKDSFSVRLPSIDSKVKDSEEGYITILDYLTANGSTTLSRMSSDMMISIYYLKKILKIMESKGLVFTMGIGANRRIFPVIHMDLCDLKKRDDIRLPGWDGILGFDGMMRTGLGSMDGDKGASPLFGIRAAVRASSAFRSSR